MRLIKLTGSPRYRRILQRSVLGLLIAVITVWSIGPIYWIFITGLKDSEEVYLNPPTVFPHRVTFESIRYIFTERPFAYYLRNSSIVAVCTVLISTSFATL
ncbi:MAG: hypothetical protein ACYTEW_27390, partial [Planctomycetota bacterium]